MDCVELGYEDFCDLEQSWVWEELSVLQLQVVLDPKNQVCKFLEVRSPFLELLVVFESIADLSQLPLDHSSS